MILIISDNFVLLIPRSTFVAAIVIRPLHIFSVLCFAFLSYSISIYTLPPAEHSSAGISRTAEGRLVWQKYNCQSCHQLYGLGGYLGPDLTNIYSAKGRGEIFIKAMLRSGVRQMPAFDLAPEEVADLLEFLKAADASGTADPRHFKIRLSGMIEQK